jgi:hypothetical protein
MQRQLSLNLTVKTPFVESALIDLVPARSIHQLID